MSLHAPTLYFVDDPGDKDGGDGGGYGGVDAEIVDPVLAQTLISHADLKNEQI